MRGLRTFTDEHDGGVLFVSGALNFPVTAFFGDSNGREIVGMDDTGSPGSSKIPVEISIAPGEGGADGFGGIAFAVALRGQDPADFRQVF